jgi:hypothetical protein
VVNVPKLPQCKILKLHLQAEGSQQTFVECMLHLLGKCVEIKIKRLNVCLVGILSNSSLNEFMH